MTGFMNRIRRHALNRAAVTTVERLEDRQLYSISYLSDPTPFAVGDNPTEVTAVDLNGDGKLDAVASNTQAKTLSVLLGDGAGHLALASTVALTQPVQKINPADFNGDGKIDLAVSISSYDDLLILPGAGDGTFGDAVSVLFGTYGSNDRFGVGDFNADGKPDLVVAGSHGASGIVVRYNTGNGFDFGPATHFAASDARNAAAVADVNNDGRSDVITLGDSDAPVGVYINNGSGFDPQVGYPVSYTSNDVEIGANDVNGDGKLDVIVLYGGGSFDVLLNQGNGALGAPHAFVTLGGEGYAIADMDRDGKADFLSVNWLYGDISIATGNGDGTFNEKKNEYLFGSTADDMAVGDFNGDGKPDVLVADAKNDQVLLVTNLSAGGNPDPGGNNGGGTPDPGGNNGGGTPDPGGNNGGGTPDPGGNNGGGTPTAPDLTAAITPLFGSAMSGGKGAAKVTVQNVGNLPFHTTANISLYLSADDVYDTGDILVSTKDMKLSLAVSHGKSIGFKFNLPANVTDGNYKMLAKVEGAGDGNAANNVSAPSTPVAVSHAFVDFTASISGAFATVAHGKPIKASLLLANGGNMTAQGSVTVSYYASANGTLDGSEMLIATRTSNVKVAFGKSKTLKLTSAHSLPAGSFYLIAKVQGLDDQAAGNNIAVSPTPINVS